MDAAELRALQAPIKKSFKKDPERARVVSRAEGRFQGSAITCTVDGWAGPVVAGVHPAAGGDGSNACSADMLLESLVACAGVTLRSVATAMGVVVNDARISAEGVWDARGTLGISKDAPVGLTDVTLRFELDTDADPAKTERLVSLTERYCVIYQTLRQGPNLELEIEEG